MTLMPMRRKVQGQGHSKNNSTAPDEKLGEVLLRQWPWALTLAREKLLVLPTDAIDIEEVCPWHNTVVVPNLKQAL